MNHFVHALTNVETAHRNLLEKLRKAIKREGLPLSTEQASILLRTGNRPCKVGELPYFGTNICYNLNKLERLGYIERVRIDEDLRARLVNRTEKGDQMCKRLLERLNETYS